MTGKAHESLVADQFGPRAAAYVLSAVHAQGCVSSNWCAAMRAHARSTWAPAAVM